MFDRKVLVMALIGYLLAGAPGLIIGAVLYYFIGSKADD